MKKINLLNYNVLAKDENGKDKEVPFQTKESLIELLFIPQLQLNALKLLEQHKLAEKIKGAGDYVLLEEEEYRRVQKAFSLFEGFDKYAIELVKRVIEAEEVEVEAK